MPRPPRPSFAVLVALACLAAASTARAQLGACCNVIIGTCSIQPQVSCGPAAHDWLAGGACSPNTCALPGACCDPSSALCRRLTQDRCLAGSSLWSAGTCSTVACSAAGQCCNFFTGNCTLTLQSACGLASHTFIAGETCNPNTCPASGACCSPGGVCQRLTQPRCSPDSLWTSGGLCSAGPCTTLGRCCNFFTGSCTSATQSACGPAAHTWTPGAACTPNDCPQPGACCTFQGACSRLTQERCSGSGVWSSGGTCSPSPCFGGGRCCNFFVGSCTITPQSECGAAAHTWSPGGVCDPNTCEQPGACCITGACRRLTQSQCGARVGQFILQGTCAPFNPCPVSLALQSCPADVNRSGTVDITDVFDFLTAWLADTGAPSRDGPRGPDALLAFINAWFVGCP
jgi:hypothetical protein